jgi:hypothetical protein
VIQLSAIGFLLPGLDSTPILRAAQSFVCECTNRRAKRSIQRLGFAVVRNQTQGGFLFVLLSLGLCFGLNETSGALSGDLHVAHVPICTVTREDRLVVGVIRNDRPTRHSLGQSHFNPKEL